MNKPEKNDSEVPFTSTDAVIVVFDGPGDNSRRPRRPNNPREWPAIKPVERPRSSPEGPPLDQSK